MKKEEQDEALRTTGNLLKVRRESIGMSRSTLAMKVGTTYESIRFYEEGRRAMRLDRLFALLSALGIPANGLLSTCAVEQISRRKTPPGASRYPLQEGGKETNQPYSPPPRGGCRR